MRRGLCKNVYCSRKRGVEWWLYSGRTIADELLDITTCYILPTVRCEHSKTAFEDDQSFEFLFQWLFWYFSITRYWGSVYTKGIDATKILSRVAKKE